MPTPSDDRPSWWWVVATLASGAALALGLALAVTTLGEGEDGRPRAAAGDVLRYPYAEDPLPHAGEVHLPWQRVDVAIGTPARSLPDIGLRPSDVAPPEGGSFVRVDARADTSRQVPFTMTARPLTTQVELVLRADGTEYPLSGAEGLRFDPNGLSGPGGGSRWVAVPGSPTDLEVAVLVDGQEQTVHTDGRVTSGRAAELEQLPTETFPLADPIGCGTSRRTDDSDLRIDYPESPGCHLTAVLRTPFVDGLGWARSGRAHLVVAVDHDDSLEIEDADGERMESSSRLVARLDGREPTAGPTRVNHLARGTLGLQDPDDPVQLVFDVPATGDVGDLVLRLETDARPRDPFVPGPERLGLEWTVPERSLR